MVGENDKMLQFSYLSVKNLYSAIFCNYKKRSVAIQDLQGLLFGGYKETSE